MAESEVHTEDDWRLHRIELFLFLDREFYFVITSSSFNGFQTTYFETATGKYILYLCIFFMIGGDLVNHSSFIRWNPINLGDAFLLMDTQQMKTTYFEA